MVSWSFFGHLLLNIKQFGTYWAHCWKAEKGIMPQKYCTARINLIGWILSDFLHVISWLTKKSDSVVVYLMLLLSTLVLSYRAWLSKSIRRSTRANLLRSLSNCCGRKESIVWNQMFYLCVFMALKGNNDVWMQFYFLKDLVPIYHIRQKVFYIRHYWYFYIIFLHLILYSFQLPQLYVSV